MRRRRLSGASLPSARASASAIAIVDAGEHVLPPCLGGDAPRGGAPYVEKAVVVVAADLSSTSKSTTTSNTPPATTSTNLRSVPGRRGVERVPCGLQPGPQRACPQVLAHLQVREGPGRGGRGRREALAVVERRGVARALEHLELDRGREGREGLRVNRAVRWDEDIEPVVGIRRV